MDNDSMKKTYSRPELVRFGSVEEFTQKITGGIDQNQSTGTNNMFSR